MQLICWLLAIRLPGDTNARTLARTHARTLGEHPLLLARWRRPFDHTFPLPTTTTPPALVPLSRLLRLLLSCRPSPRSSGLLPPRPSSHHQPVVVPAVTLHWPPAPCFPNSFPARSSEQLPTDATASLVSATPIPTYTAPSSVQPKTTTSGLWQFIAQSSPYAPTLPRSTSLPRSFKVQRHCLNSFGPILMSYSLNARRVHSTRMCFAKGKGESATQSAHCFESLPRTKS